MPVYYKYIGGDNFAQQEGIIHMDNLKKAELEIKELLRGEPYNPQSLIVRQASKEEIERLK